MTCRPTTFASCARPLPPPGATSPTREQLLVRVDLAGRLVEVAVAVFRQHLRQLVASLGVGHVVEAACSRRDRRPGAPRCCGLAAFARGDRAGRSPAASSRFAARTSCRSADVSLLDEKRAVVEHLLLELAAVGELPADLLDCIDDGGHLLSREEIARFDSRRVGDSTSPRPRFDFVERRQVFGRPKRAPQRRREPPNRASQATSGKGIVDSLSSRPYSTLPHRRHT